MHSSLKIVSLLSLLAPVLASPAPDTLRLDNGSEMVNATRVGRDVVSGLEARGNLDCKGSAFCELLGSSCDVAFRQIKPGNTYLTGGNKGASGTCSGTCGVFISGDHCSVLGVQLQDSYKAIRKNGCSHCGRETLDDGCMVKIDRVKGC